MDTDFVTTPFGRRPMTRAMLTGQSKARDVAPTQSIDKWKLYRALCEARGRLGVSDRTLALLNALLSFYPKTELSSETGLVVFPSNQQLSLRANGMAEQTIRRHLALLVNAGLIARKDSANGKRYSRRHRDGEVREAFGFSLAPLLARSCEIEAMARDVIAERIRLQNVRESLTICRRDIAKLIAMAETEKAPGAWPTHYAAFRDIIDGIPRNADIAIVTAALQDLRALRSLIINILEQWRDSENPSGNPSQNERHIQKSESHSSFDSEPEPASNIADPRGEERAAVSTRDPAIPLSLVLTACPAIADYAPAQDIRDWRDLATAANVVGQMFGISPSAYQAACATMGIIPTAVAVSCILERSEHIQSPGGYLRHLTRQSQAGSFSAAQMLMGLMKTRGQTETNRMRH